MSFSDKVTTSKKLPSLNPNAAEFIPFSLRSSTGSTSIENGATSMGKSVLDRSESSISNHSDEESHQYWCRQLPDDITPDFKVIEEESSQGININSIPFSTLSLLDSNQSSRVSASTQSGSLLKERHDLFPPGSNGIGFSDKMRYSVPSYSEDAISGNFLNASAKPWDKQTMNNDHFMSLLSDEAPYNSNSTHDLLNQQALSENTEMDPLECLASQFPGFASDSLAEVYIANGGDLNLTIEMLAQLELQVDCGLNQNLNSKTPSAPNLTAMDFPALSVHDGLNSMPKYSDDIQQCASSYQPSSKDNLLMFKTSSTFPTRGAVDFATALRKTPPSDGGIWQYERKGSADASVGSSRSSHVLASSYNSGQGRGVYSDRLQSRSSSRAAPVWLDTGEAVANMYSEVRGEARDHARLRNVYFEQARQAYLIGNKALAKELSVKGQLHNIHMKAAHGKAQESIYRQRNPVGSEMQGNSGRGQERLIDLHGLHVNEAIHVLKRELTVLRSTARSSGQRLQVYICVGTGHHTRGSRTPARLPVAIQRYLLEDEGLDYTEPQPGLLRVLVY